MTTLAAKWWRGLLSCCCCRVFASVSPNPTTHVTGSNHCHLWQRQPTIHVLPPPHLLHSAALSYFLLLWLIERRNPQPYDNCQLCERMSDTPNCKKGNELCCQIEKDRVMTTITTTRSAENQTFQIRKQTNQPNNLTYFRAAHNELEKTRRANLRGYLEKLKSLVPPIADASRNTTLALLTRARDHIKVLLCAFDICLDQ